MLDRDLLQKIFAENPIHSVIHCRLKAVGESVQKPAEYYMNNVTGSLVLLQEMKKAGVREFRFQFFPPPFTVILKSFRLPKTAKWAAMTNPYGTSKFMVEQILRDIAKAEPKFSMTILRYFNPVGAHESGLIGEDPNGIPNNLLPYIS